MTAIDPAPPKPKLRWYQFSLRTLLIVTLVVAVFFGWVASSRLRRAKQNREAMAEVFKVKAEIENLGGRVVMAFDRAAGVLYIAEVRIPQGPFGEAELEHLKGLTKIEYLSLSYTQVTDAGLVHLGGLTNLKWLNLSHTQVTDAGLVHLKGLTNLEFLHLSYTQVTDEGVKKLQEALPNCYIHIRH